MFKLIAVLALAAVAVLSTEICVALQQATTSVPRATDRRRIAFKAPVLRQWPQE